MNSFLFFSLLAVCHVGVGCNLNDTHKKRETNKQAKPKGKLQPQKGENKWQKT
jgi:hypothetical protein